MKQQPNYDYDKTIPRNELGEPIRPKPVNRVVDGARQIFDSEANYLAEVRLREFVGKSRGRGHVSEVCGQANEIRALLVRFTAADFTILHEHQARNGFWRHEDLAAMFTSLQNLRAEIDRALATENPRQEKFRATRKGGHIK